MTIQKTHATYFLFALSVLFNLSQVPGLATEIGSADLLSSSCNIEDQVKSTGSGECKLKRSGGKFAIEKKQKFNDLPKGQQGPPTPGEVEYVATVEGAYCEDGTCSRSQTAKTLEDALKLRATLLKQIKEEITNKKMCELDEDGDPYEKESEKLTCLTDNLKELKGEEADEYYADFVRPHLKKLLQSGKMDERALAMGALERIGEDKDIQCPARPGLQLPTSPVLMQESLMPIMNADGRMSLAGTPISPKRDLIPESACDLWAFGTYAHNMEYLNLMAKDPNISKQDIRRAAQELNSGLGNYTRSRGLVLANDPLGLNGRSSGLLQPDLQENSANLQAKMDGILSRYSDIMNANQTPANSAPNNAGRLVRGGNRPWPDNAPAAPTNSAPTTAPQQNVTVPFGGAPAPFSPVSGRAGGPPVAAPRR